MEIIILGSGTGAPALKRNASGLLIKVGNKNLLFDTGPGIVKKLLELGVTYHDIDHIFYSHFHSDHTLDLVTLLFAAKYVLSLRTRELSIIGPTGLDKLYHSLLDVYGEVISPEAYNVSLREVGEEVFKFAGCKLQTKRMQHCPESLGYRVESNGKVVVYSGDTDVCKNIIELAVNADILVLDCSFPDQMKVKGHLVPQEAGEIATSCNCKKLVLSHLYPVCNPEQIIKQAKARFRGEVIVASDLLSLAV